MHAGQTTIWRKTIISVAQGYILCKIFRSGGEGGDGHWGKK